MAAKNLVVMLHLTLLVALIFLASCGGRSASESGLPLSSAPRTDTPPGTATGELPGLPADGVHVWETTDARGFVVPDSRRGIELRGVSAFPASAELSVGRDRFLESAGVIDNGEASTVSAAVGESAWAMYRLTMSGQQPGAVSVDVNLLPPAVGTSSEYYVGLSDYAAERWHWVGPLSDGRTTFELPAGGDWLSPLGNLFVTLLAHDGSSFDAVAIAAAQRDGADTTAPPAPGALTAESVAGGAELQWLPVVAGDLAGYRVYYRYAPFTVATPTSDLRRLEYLENTTHAVIPLPRRLTYLAVAAVDLSGNESALSEPVSVFPGSGTLTELSVTVDAPSGLRNTPLTLTASGADSYDFDLDGDGVFEVTGSGSGVASVDTSQAGLIRPRVRGTSGDTGRAMGAVSLVISGNSRPVASGTATPSSGYSPLTVIYNGEGFDDDGTIVEYAWSTIGDGIYDKTSPTAGGPFNRNLHTPGLYNAKFRVTDDQGAFDVDTVAIQVLANTMEITFNPGYPDPGDPVLLTAQAPGPATLVEWDVDGDGTYELSSGTSSITTHNFTQPGRYPIGCRVVLAAGGTLSGVTHVQVRGWRWEESPDPTPSAGDTLSLLEVQGHPAIVYRIGPGGSLNYVRANDPDGTTWGTPLEIDPLSSAWPTMLIVNGNPAVAYRRFGGGQGFYVRAADSIGSTWSAPLDLGASTVTAAMPFTVVGASPGVPAVALADGTDLRFRRASDPNGDAWEPAVIVDNVDLPGSFASMTVVDGHPAISYQRATVQDLYYARADDPGGTLWGAPMGLHVTGNNSGNHTAMAIVQGRPAIWFIDETAQEVLLRRAQDATGTSWVASQVLDSTDGASSDWMDAKVIGGIPCFTYRRTPQIRFGRANDAAAESWPATTSVKPSNNISSIAEIQGRPSIAVYAANELHFAKLY